MFRSSVYLRFCIEIGILCFNDSTGNSNKDQFAYLVHVLSWDKFSELIKVLYLFKMKMILGIFDTEKCKGTFEFKYTI